MIKSLTRIERSEFMKMAVVRLAHPAACSADVDEHDQARIRLRYEYTLAQQDAQIAAFQAQLEAESDIQHAQRAQIEALVTALREITAMQMTPAPNRSGVNMFLDAQMVAFFAIKEATNGS